MLIISQQLSNILYTYLVYVYQYNPEKKMKLRYIDIHNLAKGIGISFKQLICLLSLCNWCRITEKCKLFKHIYYIEFISNNPISEDDIQI